MALSTENIGKNEFLTGKDVLPEKDLLEKAATIKYFEYSLLDSQLKKQTDIAKCQYNTKKSESISKEMEGLLNKVLKVLVTILIYSR